VSLRWEAIAADGTLFTALEADLMLFPAGDQNTTLALAGGYRPQPGPAGAGLDQVIVRRCATVAIRSFVAQVAGVLGHPAGTAGLASGPGRRAGTGWKEGGGRALVFRNSRAGEAASAIGGRVDGRAFVSRFAPTRIEDVAEPPLPAAGWVRVQTTFSG